MHVRPVELVQVTEFLQGIGDRGVGQLGLRHRTRVGAGPTHADDDTCT